MAETQQDNRNWQKNAQLREKTTCAGTNLNRNWPMNWDVSMPDDGAYWPCRTTFKGNSPADTQEVRSIMDLMDGKFIKLSIEWQANGQRGEPRFLSLPRVTKTKVLD